MLKKYIVPAIKTLEWAFQDWGLSVWHCVWKEKSYAALYEKICAWILLFNKNIGLILPKKEKWRRSDTDPLNGQGWVGKLTHGRPRGRFPMIYQLVELMGGGDAFCKKLNYAFEHVSD